MQSMEQIKSLKAFVRRQHPCIRKNNARELIYKELKLLAPILRSCLSNVVLSPFNATDVMEFN